MKKFVILALLITLGVTVSLVYTSKPEAKAGFASKSFRINLRDGNNEQDDYFGVFGISGPNLGKATGPNYDSTQNHLFDNWQGSLIVHFEAILKGPHPTLLYPIEIYAGGYNWNGYSDVENLTGAQVNYDVDWFKQARNLSITNFDEVPILAMEAWWHNSGLVYELDPYNPTDPDINNLYWVAEENGQNIDINIAIYPVAGPPPDYNLNWHYPRACAYLPTF